DYSDLLAFCQRFHWCLSGFTVGPV
ncbi:uncharacterized protein METZ01_LOCUS326987, partial [marine metagenome]